MLAVPDDTQPDNESTPGEIASGASVAATIDYRGDVDWFETSLEAGLQYVATIRQRSDWPLKFPVVSVYDANGNKVRVSYLDAFNSQASFAPAEGGTFYIAAASRFDRSGRYTLELRYSGFSISGTPVVGRTLTADTSGIEDADGLSNASYSYQWLRVDTDTDTEISGATSRTYTLTEDDAGKSIRVRATFIDDAGNDETRVSIPTGPVRAAVTVFWGSSSYTAVERAAGATVTVKLSADPKGAVTVPIEVERQGGAGTGDYSGVPDSVTFDGDSQTDGSDRPYETFTVTAEQDGDVDDESISLSFGTLPAGVTPGGQTAATVELLDLVREAPDHWLLVPEGVGAGGEFRLLFATSGRRNASSSDIAVYNTFVQDAASSGLAQLQDYSDHFAALASTEAVEARVNTATTHTSSDRGVPIYWLEGPKAADQYQDFYDNSWDHRDPGRNEDGSEVDFDGNNATDRIWTGSQENGAEGFSSGNSRALGRSTVRHGSPGQGSGSEISHGAVSSSNSYRLYGLSYVFRVTDTDIPYVVRDGVEVTSTPEAGTDTYGAGEDIEITVTFNEAVVVSGTPQFWLSVGGGKLADLVSGSGSTQLVFAYTVQSGDADTDGIWIPGHDNSTNRSFRLDSGDAVTGVETGADAILQNLPLGTQSKHKVDGSMTGADARLSALSLSGITLAPAFAAGIESYTATVDNSVSATTVTATPSQSSAGVVTTPTDADTVASGHQVDLDVGANTITVTVTGTNSTSTRTYTVTVTRLSALSADADLSTLTIDGTSVTGFAADTTAYTMNVVNATARVTVAATASDGNAVVSYSPADADTNTTPHEVDLDVGNTTVTVTVTAEDGTTKIYSIAIYRAAAFQVTAQFGAATYTAAEGGAAATVTVNLSADPGETVTIPITASGAGGAVSGDYSLSAASVTINSGQTSATFTVTASDDSDDDGESVTLGLGTLPPGVSAGTQATATVSLTDNDDPRVTAQFGAASYTAAEDGATATVTVNLSADPERSVTIPITASGAGGAGSGDYSLSASSVTIASGQTSATFTVTATDDGDDDDDDGESVSLSFGNLPSGVSAGTQATATVALTDDDHPRVTAQFGAASYTATEGGAAATVTVNLSADPERSVTIPITAAGADGAVSGDYSLSANSVTISSGQTSATFTVTATDENDIDDGESVTLGFGVFPDRVSAGAQASATVELVNDDVVAVKVTFVEERYVAVEGTHGAVVKVQLDKDPERTVEIPITVTPRNGAGSADFTLPATSVTINSGELHAGFTVTATEDGVTETGEYVHLTFGTLPAGVTGGLGTLTDEVLLRDIVQDVPSDWAGIPSGLEVGDEFRLLFVDTNAWLASSPYSSTYNDYLNEDLASTLISNSGYINHVGFLGSTVGVNARDHTGTTHTSAEPGVPIYWLGGPKVADDYADFYDGSWDHSNPGRDHNGDELNFTTGTFIWTGSNSDGTLATDSAGNSQGMGSSNVQVGRPGQGAGNEIHSSATFAPGRRHFYYGLSYVFRVVQSGNADLSALTIDGTSVTGFAADTTSYTMDVENVTAQVTVAATASHTNANVAYSPADADTGVNGHQLDLIVGDNTVTVTVTAEDATTKAYTVTITRADPPSSDADLTALTIDGTSVTAFAADTTSYTLDVPFATAQVIVAATKSHTKANVVITPADANTGTTAHDVDLSVLGGAGNTVTVTVTAEDGTTKAYTVTITRAEAGTNADLSDLTIDGSSVSDFAADKVSYTMSLPNSTGQVTVEATKSDIKATVVITPAAAAAAAGYQVDLSGRESVITATVTAEDGATKAYKVTINRAVVPHDWSLRPPGIVTGTTFRVLIVTTSTRDATAAGIGAYDGTVRWALDNRGHSDIRDYSPLFKALAGTKDGASPKDHTGTDPDSDGTGEEIWWLNGPRAANDYADFYDGDWDHSNPARTEAGAT